jgi:hypothetical protein
MAASTWTRTVGALVVSCGLALACAAHPGEPVMRSGIFIPERGIAVPVPPPSLTSEPEVDADICGEIVEIGFDDGTEVHLYDSESGYEADVPAISEGYPFEDTAHDFCFEGVPVDLTANCLEFWTDEIEPVRYRLVIDGETVGVREGCDRAAVL